MQEFEAMRLSLEPLLYQAGVDIVFNGHGISLLSCFRPPCIAWPKTWLEPFALQSSIKLLDLHNVEQMELYRNSQSLMAQGWYVCR